MQIGRRYMRLLKKIYYRMVQQRLNLLYPVEQYLQDKNNENKADKLRMDYVYNLHSHLSGTMLDIGCNDGYFMRNYNWTFQKMIGIDIYSINNYTKGMFEKNKEYYSKNGKIRYIRAFFEEYEFVDQFDFVFAGEIIEHVLDVNVFLEKFHSVIKNRGHFCLTVPDDVGKKQPEHNRQFNYESLNSLLEKYFSDFKIDVLKTPEGSWDFLIAYRRKI